MKVLLSKISALLSVGATSRPALTTSARQGEYFTRLSMLLSVRFVTARDNLGIVKAVIGHLKSALGKTGVARCPMPVARFQDFRVGCPSVAVTVPL
jgi:hypothetical protein